MNRVPDLRQHYLKLFPQCPACHQRVLMTKNVLGRSFCPQCHSELITRERWRFHIALLIIFAGIFWLLHGHWRAIFSLGALWFLWMLPYSFVIESLGTYHLDERHRIPMTRAAQRQFGLHPVHCPGCHGNAIQLQRLRRLEPVGKLRLKGQCVACQTHFSVEGDWRLELWGGLSALVLATGCVLGMTETQTGDLGWLISIGCFLSIAGLFVWQYWRTPPTIVALIQAATLSAERAHTPQAGDGQVAAYLDAHLPDSGDAFQSTNGSEGLFNRPGLQGMEKHPANRTPTIPEFDVDAFLKDDAKPSANTEAMRLTPKTITPENPSSGSRFT